MKNFLGGNELTLVLPIFIVCLLRLLHIFKMHAMEANTMNPEQASPKFWVHIVRNIHVGYQST